MEPLDAKLGALKLEKPGEGRGEKIEHADAVKALKGTMDNALQSAKSDKLRQSLLKFVVDAALNNPTQKALQEKYAAEKFDQDNEVGLDRFEFENFKAMLEQGVQNLVTLQDFDRFADVEGDIRQDIGKFSPQSYLKKFTGGRSLTDMAIARLNSNVPPEETKKLLEAKWSDPNFFEGVAFSIGREAPQMIEDVVMFLGDAAYLATAGMPVVAQYTYYRTRENAAEFFGENSHEYKMKVDAMGEQHMVLGLLNLLGERGGTMAGEIFKKIGTPSSWTAEGIAITITSILGLIAGGAGAVRLGAKAGSKLAKGSRFANMAERVGQKAEKFGRAVQYIDDVTTSAPVTGIIKGVEAGAKGIGRGIQKAGAAIQNVKKGVQNLGEAYAQSPLASERGFMKMPFADKIAEREQWGKIKTMAAKLQAEGLDEIAKELLDRDAKFSGTFGTPIGTLDARIAFGEQYANMTPKEKLVYAYSPTLHAHIHDLRAKGFLQDADILSDLEHQFANVDLPIGTKEEKLAHAKRLLSLDDAERAQYIHGRNFRFLNDRVKEFNSQYALAVTVPELVVQKTKPQEALRRIHKTLDEGWDQSMDYGERADNIGGEYRKKQVTVGQHVPPGADDLPVIMDMFSRRLEVVMDEIKMSNRSIPDKSTRLQNAYTVAAWAHQKFVDIHPFYGGNGRTARVFFDYVVQTIMDGERLDPTEHRYLPVDSAGSLNGYFQKMISGSQERTFPPIEWADTYHLHDRSFNILRDEMTYTSTKDILDDWQYKTWKEELILSTLESRGSTRFNNVKSMEATIDYELMKIGVSFEAGRSEAIVSALMNTSPEFIEFFLLSPERSQIVEAFVHQNPKPRVIPSHFEEEWQRCISSHNH